MKRVLNTKYSVAEQMRFAKQISYSPHLHHVATNCAELAFMKNIKAHNASLLLLFPKKQAFRGPLKNSFIFLMWIRGMEVFFKESTVYLEN